MKILKTKFKGTFKIKHKKNFDKRGYFVRDFCKETFKKKNIKFEVRQTNFSYNKKMATLRGFHYQKKPFSEAKIVSCLKGKLLLVLLNVNKSSKNYLKYIKFVLKENDNTSILISKECATAFLTLKKNTLVLYYMSDIYKKNKGIGIRYNDPKLNLKWPVKPKIISVRDNNFTNLQ